MMLELFSSTQAKTVDITIKSDITTSRQDDAIFGTLVHGKYLPMLFEHAVNRTSPELLGEAILRLLTSTFSHDRRNSDNGYSDIKARKGYITIIDEEENCHEIKEPDLLSW